MMQAAHEFYLCDTCYLHTFDQRQNFDAGSAVFTVGKTVTGTASGATGTVKSVTLSTGSWAGGTAAGYLVLSNVAGTFQNNEAISDNNTVPGAATADGANSDYVTEYGKRSQTVSLTATTCRFVQVQAPEGVTEYDWKGRFPVVQFAPDQEIEDPAGHGGAVQELTTTDDRFAGQYAVQWPPVRYSGHISCALKAVG